MPDPIEEPATDVALDDAPDATPAVENPVLPSNFGDLADAIKQETGLTDDSKHVNTVDPQGRRIPGTEPTPRDETGKFQKKDALAAKPDEAPAEEKKPDVAAAAEDATKPRDADLDADTDSQMRPNTRKRFDAVKAAAKAARDERDARAAEAATIAKERDELRQQLKTQVVPKEAEEELKTLRTRVRELDISKDPAIEAKYDAKIKANSATAMELLKEQGLFKKAGAKPEDPLVEMSAQEQKALTAEIERGGIGINGMAKYIRALESGGEYAAAERLRAAAQHNDRLTAEKAEEIQKWSKDYEGLQATRTQQQEAQRTAHLKAVADHGTKALQEDLTALQKQLPFLARPAEIAASDSPEVKASKQNAIKEYVAAIATLNDSARAFNTDGLPPEKAAEVAGKMNAAAMTALILKNHVIPRLLKEQAANVARIKELEGDAAARRKAGTINRAHSAALAQPDNGKRAPAGDLSIEDALKQVAAESGINVNS